MENYPEFPFANLNYAGGHAWPPDLHFGRQKQYLEVGGQLPTKIKIPL
jgi:hypothetical protein